jgi:pyruvate dehydrogenase E2 component (dihydrolipoamide acetyltransferase)
MNADGNSLKVFHHVNLGVAVALPGDEMVTAVIRNSDEMSETDFYQAFATQVAAAKETGDQADESTTVTVSNIGKAGMRIGIPAIVAPAVATLAIGESFAHPVPDGDSFRFQTMVTATLSFDHRIANGVGAANFMREVKSGIEAVEA